MENKALILLELRKLWGINELCYGKDRKGYRIITAAGPLLLSLILAFYMGALCYGLMQLGIEEAKLKSLILLALSSLLLMLGFFRTGAQLFPRTNSDILLSMPLQPKQIISARWLRLYLEDLPVALLPVISSLAVMCKEGDIGLKSCILMLISALFLPFIPISVSGILSILTERIAEGKQRRVIISAALTAAEFLAVGALLNLVPIFIMETLDYCIYWAVSLAMSLIMSTAAAKAYFYIYEGKKPAYVKREAEVNEFENENLRRTLVQREWRQYLSHGNYVANTVIGPVLAVAFSVTALFTDFTKLGLPLSLEPLLPFLPAILLAMMNPTVCSLSIEGKNWWILKTMPLSTRDIVRAKVSVGMRLPLIAAFISGVLLAADSHESLTQIFACLMVPVSAAFFSAVWGLSANFRFPNFKWEDEVEVVKQGAASLVGGLVPAILILACGFLAGILPDWGSIAAACNMLAAAQLILHSLYNRRLP